MLDQEENKIDLQLATPSHYDDDIPFACPTNPRRSSTKAELSKSGRLVFGSIDDWLVSSPIMLSKWSLRAVMHIFTILGYSAGKTAPCCDRPRVVLQAQYD